MRVQSINNIQQTKSSSMQNQKNRSFGSIEINKLNEVLGPAQEIFSTKLAEHVKSLIEAFKNYKLKQSLNKAGEILQNVGEFIDSDGQRLSEKEITSLQAKLTGFITTTSERLTKKSKLRFTSDTTFMKTNGKSGKTELLLQPFHNTIQDIEKYDGCIYYDVKTANGILFDETKTRGVSLSKKISTETGNTEILGGKRELQKGDSGYKYDSDSCDTGFYSNIRSIGSFDDKPGIFVEKDNTSYSGKLLYELFDLLNSPNTESEIKLDSIIKTAKQSEAVIRRQAEEQAAAQAKLEAKKSNIKGLFE